MTKSHIKKSSNQYQSDFYLWAMTNAKLLKAGKVTEIDFINLAEEIESMGKSERRELLNRLSVLIAHLLKWLYQPQKRSKSWELTIREQRFEIADLLADSPSLKPELEKQLDHAFEKALILAEKESGLARKTFGKECPFSLKAVINPKFFPE